MNPLWQRVAAELASKEARLAGSVAGEQRLNSGQRATLRELADGLPGHGMMVADEVGMGKTRIAVELVESVVLCGGRVAVLLHAQKRFIDHARRRQRMTRCFLAHLAARHALQLGIKRRRKRLHLRRKFWRLR